MIASQLALRIQKRYALDAARMYKAVEIVNKNEIKLLPSGNYAAKSHSQNGAPVEYMVNPRSESCNCIDCEQSGNLCKHIAAWLLLREMSRYQKAVQLADLMIKHTMKSILETPLTMQERELAARAKRDAMKRTEWVEEI